MPASSRQDPYKRFNFLVQIDGVNEAGFTEVQGLETSVDVIDYREGGDRIIRKLPGLRRVGNVTLKRGVTKSRELQDWHRNILQGQMDRRAVAIILLDDAGQEVVRWVLSDAWPFKWEGPDLDALSSQVAIEALVLCCEGIERES
jgi:phage tail-like protein